MPLIHESLGSIYYQMGKFELAKTEWLLAVSLTLNVACPEFLRKLNTEHPELFGGGNQNESLDNFFLLNNTSKSRCNV